MYIKRFLQNAFIASLFAIGFTACQKESGPVDGEAASATENLAGSSIREYSFYALTAANELVKYQSGLSIREVSIKKIIGIAEGEKLLAIDFRPATGQLYSVSSHSKLYTINLNTGMASAVGSAFVPAIRGDYVGFDFNPTVDRIRLVTSNGQNLRLNPVTGTVAAVDGNITPASANVTAVAYTNSFAGATTTTLYDIDLVTDQLYIQSPPNNGTLVAVGSLGVNAVREVGFDISPDNAIALIVFFGRGSAQDQEENEYRYRFYHINLATGEAKNAGKTIREMAGLAISPNP